jgi:predicted O-methyltransferase YrrM
VKYNIINDSVTSFDLTNWPIAGKSLLPLIENIESPIGLEIGVDIGISSEYLLKNKVDLVIHGIDPYSSYVDWNGNNLNENERTNIFMNMKRLLDPYGKRFILHRATSDEAVNDFSDNFFDYIFVDGVHTYDQVLLDCKNYYSKVKSGGIFSGHDFNTISGVHDAVIEFAQEVGAKIETLDNDVWYWYKA